MDFNITTILRKNQLSVTDSRKQILELFIKSGNALAHHDIETRTGLNFDRVTVYRTLQAFMDKGIIHTIPTPDNSIKYALCKDNCTEGHHQDNHVHFVCDVCSSTICLDRVVIPTVDLPKEFLTRQINVVINGICEDCR